MTLQYHSSNLEITEIINPQTGQVYTMGQFLGAGVSGEVYESISNGKHYAIKITPDLDDYEKEVEIYERISLYPRCNPHVVCLYNHFEIDLEEPSGILVLELMAGTLLPLKDEEVSEFILDMLEALVELHTDGIIQGDINQENIYRSYAPSLNTPTFKIGDFSQGVSDASPSQIQEEDREMAETFLKIIYGEYTTETTLEILKRGIIYPRRESTIPSDAIETMIRGMLWENEDKRWSSEEALEYILEVMNR